MPRVDGRGDGNVVVVGGARGGRAVVAALRGAGLCVVRARTWEALGRAEAAVIRAVVVLDWPEPEPDAAIACVRALRGLDAVPVLVCARAGAMGPAPDEVAALIASACSAWRGG